MFHDKPKIVFFGTPEFSLPILEALIKNNFAPVLVVTQPDKKAGRKQELVPPPVKKLALANDLPVVQPESKKELKNILEKYQPDICILVAYGMIISDDILAKPKFGFLNIHPSLLPKYRGPSPIQTVILNGEKETGVTIIELTASVDAGPIVAQQMIEIKSAATAESLHDSLSQIGAELLVKILPDYLNGKIKPKPQNESLAAYTKIIEREDGLINWQKTAQQIDCQFRAFYPWPGVFTHLAGKRLKIANLGVLGGDFEGNLSPGAVFLGQNNELAVRCGQGALELKTVQLEGKKELPGQEFLRGQKDLLGQVLK